MSGNEPTHSVDGAIDGAAPENNTPNGPIQNIRANWGHDTKAWLPEDCHPMPPNPEEWPMELLKPLSDLSIVSGPEGREDALRFIAEAFAKRERKDVDRKKPVNRDIRTAMIAYSNFVVYGDPNGNSAASAQPTTAGNGVASAQSTNADNDVASVQPTNTDNVAGAAASSSTADSSWLEPIAEEDKAEFDRLFSLAKCELLQKMAPSATNLLPFYPEAVARAYVNAGTRGAAFGQPKKGATVMTPEIAQLGPYPHGGAKNNSGPFITTCVVQKNMANAVQNERALIALETHFGACAATIFQDPDLRATEIFKLNTDILCRLACIVEDNDVTSLPAFQSMLEMTLRDASSSRPRAYPNNRKPHLSVVNVRQLQVNLDRQTEEIRKMREKEAENEGGTAGTVVQSKGIPSALPQGGLSSPGKEAGDGRASARPPSPAPSTGDAPTHPQPDNDVGTSQHQENANQEAAGTASKGNDEEDAIMIHSSDSDSSSNSSDSDKEDIPTDNASIPHGLRRARSPSDRPTTPAVQKRRLNVNDDDKIKALALADPEFAKSMEEAEQMDKNVKGCVAMVEDMLARSGRIADELKVTKVEMAHRNEQLAAAEYDNDRLLEQNRVMELQHTHAMDWRHAELQAMERRFERAEAQKKVVEEQKEIAEREKTAARERAATLARRIEEMRDGDGPGAGNQLQDQASLLLVATNAQLANAHAQLSLAHGQAQNTITELRLNNHQLTQENARLRQVAMASVLGVNQGAAGNGGNQGPAGNDA